MNHINAYTDGSHSNGRGGYGVVITMKDKSGLNRMKKFESKPYLDTTNNRMEMKAILFTLKQIKFGHHITIHSDSKYCIDTLNKWLAGWIINNKISQKANWKIWMKISHQINLHSKNGSILQFKWVKAHNGHDLNEMADELANAARLNTEKKKVSCSDSN